MLFVKLWYALKKIYFCDVSSLIEKGALGKIYHDDVADNPQWLKSQSIHPGFNSLPLTDSNVFLKAIMALIREKYLKLVGMIVLLWIYNICAPMLVQNIIMGFSDSNRDSRSFFTVILMTIIFVILQFGHSLIFQHYVYLQLKFNQFIVTGLNRQIFSHSLKIKRKALLDKPLGDVINLLGSDCYAIAEFPGVVAECIYGLGTIIIVATMAWSFLGAAAFVALGVILILSPLCRYFASVLVKFDEEIMKARDLRVSLMSQILNGIRVFKYLVWESCAQKDVLAIRSEEIKARKKVARARSFSLLCFLLANGLSISCAFLTYVILGNKLDAATLFACIVLFERWEHPFANLSNYIADIVAAKVSSQRVISYLKTEAYSASETPTLSLASPLAKAPSLRVRNLCGYYDQKKVFGSWNFDLIAGSSTAIIGPIGGGKTSFLQALLNEIESTGSMKWLVNGVDVIPDFAWVPQKSFILNGTVQENIVFGSDLNKDLLNESIYLSGLETDLARLPGGTLAEIGEQGINLSGGQKQRFSLARSVYQNPTVCLLDDPISAVDYKTGDLIMQRLFFGKWKNHTRIMVTHRLEHLRLFDTIIMVDGGEIIAYGSYPELIKNCTKFQQFYLQTHSEKLEADDSDELNYSAHLDETDSLKVVSDSKCLRKKQNRITIDEEKENGSVRFSIYWSYLQALGGAKHSLRNFKIGLLVLSTFVVSILPIMQNYVISYGSKLGSNSTSHHGASEKFARLIAASDKERVVIYLIFAILIIMMGYFRFLFWSHQAIEAGRVFHDKALGGVLRTFIRFFDRNPIGRILNRFASDLDNLENRVPWAFEQMILSIVNVLVAALVLLAIVPIASIALLPSFVYFYWLQKRYRCVARELKRLYATTRSPRFSHFKETLEGIEAIRCYRKQAWCWEKFYSHLECNQKVFHAGIAVNRWFSVRLPVSSGFFILVMMLFLMLKADFGEVDRGIIGLALILSITFSDHLNWSVRCFSEAESNLTSVERLQEYGNLISEPQTLSNKKKENSSFWPKSGELVFHNVSLRYSAGLPRALNNISFTIGAGAKVGIVGATGSGKSSILQALFRLVPLEEGSISIDGTDIGEIPLDHLRKSIAIIPQEPILYSGTLRSNLDRFDQHSDEKIWQVLKQIQLDVLVQNFPNKLDFLVTENGSNLSLGQRQIICLGRALLTDARIVVMDEATANIDVVTDQIIQRAIRRAFFGKTLIIIAHRIDTLAACDEIITIENGSVLKIHKLKCHSDKSNGVQESFAKTRENKRLNDYVFNYM